MTLTECIFLLTTNVQHSTLGQITNTLKITKFMPRLTIDGIYACHFFIRYIKNYNVLKSPKVKELMAKTYGGMLTYDTEDRYDSNKIYIPRTFNAIIKMPSATFKALEITFYTIKENQGFCIKALEFSKIKQV